MRKNSVITIRKSPIVIMGNFIALQMIGYLAFIAAGALANYSEIYSHFSLAQVFSYHIAELTLIVLVEIVIAGYIFSKWYYEYYQLRWNSLLVARGIFMRRKSTTLFDEIVSVGHEYGLLGKIFHYGTLVVARAKGEKELRVHYIPFPEKYAAFILKLKRANMAAVPEFAHSGMLDDAEALVRLPEGEHLEFKATLRWDVRAGQVNKQLERAAMKSVAAFLNSGGGHLAIGVGDDRAVIGIEQDYATLQHGGRDGFENHFTLVFNNCIGAEYRPHVRLHFKSIEGKDICIVEVSPSRKPAYVRFDNSEDFYVRTGNTTTSLKVSEATAYIDLWRRK